MRSFEIELALGRHQSRQQLSFPGRHSVMVLFRPTRCWRSLVLLEGSHCLQNRSPPLLKSLMRRPVSKSHQWQRCSSPGLHFSGIFCRQRERRRRQRAAQRAQKDSNCTHAHIMSPTSEDSNGRHLQPSLKVDSRGYPRLEFMGIRPSLWCLRASRWHRLHVQLAWSVFQPCPSDICASPTGQFQHHHSGPLAEEQNDRLKHRTICSEIDFAGSVSLDGGFVFMWFGRELVVHFCVVCTDIF